MKRNIVYQIIDSEREFQDRFCRDQGIDSNKTLGEFLTLIRAYANKADNAWVGRDGHRNALEEVRKIAAICVACMESHGAQDRKSNFVTFNQYSHDHNANQSPRQSNHIDWVYLDSSNIDGVYYNEIGRYLLIKFHHGGIYKYENVSKAIYNGLLEAKSAGRYFNDYIKRNNSSSKITTVS